MLKLSKYNFPFFTYTHEFGDKKLSNKTESLENNASTNLITKQLAINDVNW